MQDGDRLSSQTIGNVLDRPGSQRHPGAALLPSQWTLRGLLGGAPRGPGGLTSTSMSPALACVNASSTADQPLFSLVRVHPCPPLGSRAIARFDRALSVTEIC